MTKKTREKAKEVYQLARCSKAWMLKHLRKDMPRSNIQKELIADIRMRPFSYFIQHHHDVSQVIKRLSAKQHYQIVQWIKNNYDAPDITYPDVKIPKINEAVQMSLFE